MTHTSLLYNSINAAVAALHEACQRTEWGHPAPMGAAAVAVAGLPILFLTILRCNPENATSVNTPGADTSCLIRKVNKKLARGINRKCSRHDRTLPAVVSWLLCCDSSAEVDQFLCRPLITWGVQEGRAACVRACVPSMH